MGRNNVAPLIITAVISIVLWGIGLSTGWLKEIVVFGYNMTGGLFFGNTAAVSFNEDETDIKYGKFTYRLLSSITIPDNIKLIENKAFKGNQLTSITIGKDVSLEKEPFGFGFESAYDNNNREAGTYTRTNRKAKTWITWFENFSFINNSDAITITGFKSTGTAVIPDNIYGNPVTAIADSAFKNKELTDITIPNGIAIIGNNAFDENQLTRVVIPNSVTTIGNEAFCCNQISSVTIGTRVSSIGNGAFSAGARGKGLMTGIYLPNSVTNIGLNAFNNHPIVRVSIGANVTLGSGDNGQSGVLGQGTGFNTAYSNNSRRSGVYTRPNAGSGQWSRAAR